MVAIATFTANIETREDLRELEVRLQQNVNDVLDVECSHYSNDIIVRYSMRKSDFGVTDEVMQEIHTLGYVVENIVDYGSNPPEQIIKSMR